MTLTTSELIKKSVSLSRTHMRTFCPYIIALLVTVLIDILILQIFEQTNTAAYSGATLLLSLFVGVVQLWVSLALTKEIAERYVGAIATPWKSQLNKMTHLIIPAIIISIMTTIIVFAGTLFFIIPGILFSVWYLFGSIALVLDNQRSFAALRMSKSLVMGRWWKVFFAAVVPTIAISLGLIVLEGLISFVFSLFAPDLVIDLITASISFLFVPLFLAIYTILYIELRRNPLTPVEAAPTPPPVV